MTLEAVEIFNEKFKEYDAWYDRYPEVYTSEIKAIAPIRLSGRGIEIGVGTGRFASHFRVEYGLDPAYNALRLARSRSIKVVQAVAEKMPFRNETFHFALLVATLGFVDKPDLVLKETRRILKSGATLVAGIIDRDTVWGRHIVMKADQSRFVRYARFFTAEEIRELLHETDWEIVSSYQTLFHSPENTLTVEEPQKGFGKGGFAVFHVRKT
ncbi:MAG: class I SAM-dependent methyltransferase [Candidatus Aminicenantes bacterium]|nr:class I SAM-dependent methyltransferase [Candidatus Aminicenantes bacterium]